MRSKKTYVILIVILLIFALAMYLFVGRENLQKEKEATTIIIGNTSTWNYSGKKWLNVSKKKTIKTINWKKFNVYENNNYLGKYYVWYDDSKWYYFDKNRDSINPTDKVLSYKSNFDIKIKDYTEENLTNEDTQYINYVLKEHDLSISSQFTTSLKTNIDFDSDGNIETFYIISNAFPTSFNPDQIFSIVFMVKDNTVYYLYESIDDNKIQNGCKPYFHHFLDITNDGVDELILSCGKYSSSGTIDMLYKWEDNAFKIVISNQ